MDFNVRCPYTIVQNYKGSIAEQSVAVTQLNIGIAIALICVERAATEAAPALVVPQPSVLKRGLELHDLLGSCWKRHSQASLCCS